MHRSSRSVPIMLVAVLMLCAGARAAPPQAPGDAPAAQPVVAAPPSAPVPALASASAPAPRQFGATADDALLGDARGGSDLSSIDTTLDTTLSGTVSGNSAINVLTGSNVIQSGSFANMSGIPIIVQNTGANVLIQNATVINLQLK